MDRYVEAWKKQRKQIGGEEACSSWPAQKPAPPSTTGGGRQIRIQDCKKVQVLNSSHINPRLEDMEKIRDALLAAERDDDTEEMRHQLNRLACFELTLQMLTDSKVGPVVRQLKKSKHPLVARSAGNLLEKLKGVVKRTAKVMSSKGIAADAGKPLKLNLYGGASSSMEVIRQTGAAQAEEGGRGRSTGAASGRGQMGGKEIEETGRKGGLAFWKDCA